MKPLFQSWTGNPGRKRDGDGKVRGLRHLLPALFSLLMAGSAPGTAGQGDAPMNTTTANANVRLLAEDGRPGPVVTVPKVVRTEEEWRRRLTPEQFRITRRQDTEAAFCGKFYDHHTDGLYFCVGCDLPLFDSRHKFDSGTGWPSFFQPFAPENIATRLDSNLGMTRTEILCARCGGHLGHVFPDGPPPAGLRFCLNSAALNFRTTDQVRALAAANAATAAVVTGTTVPAAAPAAPPKPALEKATFAAGCFWGVEATFREVNGVRDTRVGYCGGTAPNATYPLVCTGTTGHAESVEVTFDPAVVSYDQLLEVFWNSHDPTQFHRQGPDVGSQYRSVIFYHTPEQKAAAEVSKDKLRRAPRMVKPIVTEIVPATTFWPAEEYHQRYAEKHGRAVCPPHVMAH